MSSFENGGLPNIDFSNINLGDIDLSGVDLSGLALPGVDTSGYVDAPTPATVSPVAPATPLPLPATPVGTTPPAPVTPTETVYTDSAFKIIQETLKFYGLGDTDLLSEVQKLWLNKTIAPNSTVDDIGIQLRDTPAFQKRFPANKILADGKKPQYSVSQYLRMENDFKQRMQSSNMPPGFYDSPEDFQQLIAQDVSPDELQARIDLGYQAVNNADPTVIAEFERLYGATKGDLAAYFIDPQRARPTFDKYEAQRQARAAQVAAQAQTQAQMQLSTAEAEGLVRAGITEASQAQQGFSDIQAQQQLFAGLGPEGQAVSREEQISGTFGTNAAARQAIEKRRATRKAEFGGGGSLGETTKGVTGLTTIG